MDGPEFGGPAHVEEDLGLHYGKMMINEDEIAAAEFLELEEIRKMVKRRTSRFTPWFLDEWCISKNSELSEEKSTEGG